MRNVTFASALLAFSACVQPQAIEVWGKAGWNTDGTEAEFRQADAECYYQYRSMVSTAPTLYALTDPYASQLQNGTNNMIAAGMSGPGPNGYHTCMHAKCWDLSNRVSVRLNAATQFDQRGSRGAPEAFEGAGYGRGGAFVRSGVA